MRLEDAQLDRAEAPVRLRLSASVVGLRHEGGDPATADAVELRYVDARGQLRSVRAKQVLLACWHRVIARLTDELPATQVTALNDQVKVPLVYANVLLSNWQAFARQGVGGIHPVDGFWDEALLDFPVSMGEIRRLLHGSLGRAGFRQQRDIEAITINRWAHGYAYEYMRPWDAYWLAGPLPCQVARRGWGWGRVAIANSDAGAFAYAHSAIDQATRAVQELLPQATLPAWHTVPWPDPARIGLGG